MDSILNFKSDEKEDFYTILGCDELSSTEQIMSEYKVKALECHPDKHPDNPEAAEQFSILQKAKEILTDEAKRAEYDTWRRSGLALSYKDWVANRNTIHTSMHWATREKKEPMLEEGPSTKRPEPEGGGWQNSHWKRDDNDMLRRFRNYDI